MVARTRIHSVLRTPLLVLRTLVVARTPIHYFLFSTRNFFKKVARFLAFRLYPASVGSLFTCRSRLPDGEPSFPEKEGEALKSIGSSVLIHRT